MISRNVEQSHVSFTMVWFLCSTFQSDLSEKLKSVDVKIDDAALNTLRKTFLKAKPQIALQQLLTFEEPCE
ncbi:CLUMA_CG014626, isoform A [Clunio marinus]|uniref:CLUMA_CG014626, isoform A n=1 Tax=Clunio marinus TaxID=568069 RepID=A0A1J1IL79_9DIPT|nr:CLUMA_CG014626, isoform A [Clunio marinus]